MITGWAKTRVSPIPRVLSSKPWVSLFKAWVNTGKTWVNHGFGDPTLDFSSKSEKNVC